MGGWWCAVRVSGAGRVVPTRSAEFAFRGVGSLPTFCGVWEAFGGVGHYKSAVRNERASGRGCVLVWLYQFIEFIDSFIPA